MIIAGFDIASYKTGYFILDVENIRYKIGLIDVKGSQEDRIRKLHHESKKIIKTYEPSIIILEDIYLDDWRKHANGKTKKRGNVDTFKILAKCHGAIISCTDELMDIFYLSPTEHKELLTGYGHADKRATIWSIQKKLGLSDLGNDEADAASLVLAYLMKRQQWHILEKLKNKYEEK